MSRLLSSEGVPHGNKPELSDSNKNLVMGPRWGLTTDRRFDFDLGIASEWTVAVENVEKVRLQVIESAAQDGVRGILSRTVVLNLYESAAQ
jgi:hypothetical protein